MPLQPGEILHNGRYRIELLLGQGGFGEVYKAWDQTLDGFCAVKRNMNFNPEVHRQFQQEAKMLFKLKNASLPKVYDYFEDHQEQYLVMEYIEGEDLQDRVKRLGAPPIKQALEWIEQVCEALNYLHSRQPPVIHRDIKPANLILTAEGRVMLVDFGIAKVGDVQQMTRSGAHGVTPGFSPPEQYGPSGTDAQSDVYALAATAYLLLTGQVPEDAYLITLRERPPVQPAHQINPQVPLGVSRAVEAAMQLSRTDRTRSVGEFQATLRAPDEVKQPPVNATEVKPVVEETRLKPVPPGTQLKPVALPKPRRLNLKWLAGTLIAVLVITVVGFIAWRVGQGPKQPGPQATQEQSIQNTEAQATQTFTAQLTEFNRKVVVFLTQTARAELSGNALTATAQSGKQVADTATDVAVMSASRTQEADAAKQTAASLKVTEAAQIVLQQTAEALNAEETRLAAVTDTPTADLSIPPACTTIGQTWTSPKDGMKLMCVPQGAFSMGSDNGEPDEEPIHTVTLDAFWIDETEVTNAMYRKCVEAGTCRPPVSKQYFGDSNYDQHPIIYVTWDDAVDYCTWVERKLPTEAQWEKAARGVDGRTYPWGEQAPTCDLANKNGCVGVTSPVGSYPAGASPYGALDMAGNVWEWVADWYGSTYYYSQSEWYNPMGPSKGDFGILSARVLRGCCFGCFSQVMYSSNRVRHVPSDLSGEVGFRCSRSP
jgi:formylglycine-generating enzyme required for sulfatase activity/serine/threonine protein kinase